MARLLIVIPVSIFIIFILLFTTFGNLRHSLLILLNLPFALSGGIFALLLRDLHMSVSASIGFIALFGVAVLNGIVLISHINQLVKEGHDLQFAIIKGASNRLRPVLMTALVASLGFIPMALSHGTGAEVQRPLATVVIGGLITSTLLTLLVRKEDGEAHISRQRSSRGLPLLCGICILLHDFATKKLRLLWRTTSTDSTPRSARLSPMQSGWRYWISSETMK